MAKFIKYKVQSCMDYFNINCFVGSSHGVSKLESKFETKLEYCMIRFP
jgi:hypothetical protein